MGGVAAIWAALGICFAYPAPVSANWFIPQALEFGHQARGVHAVVPSFGRADAQTTPPATVWTKYGMVKVVWKDVAGERCWFCSGTGDAKREAVPAIEHVEQMCMSMH